MVNEWPTEPSSRCDSTAQTENLSRNTSSKAAVSKCSVLETLNELKIVVQAERLNYVKSRLEENFKNLQEQLREVERLSRLRNEEEDSSVPPEDGGTLSGKNRSRLGAHRQGFSLGKCAQICSKLMSGNCEPRKIVFIDLAKLELVSRLPSYTTWMFVDRNERMAKDQSIARRRRISYESNGKETFFCIDEEEEWEDVEEIKDNYGLSEAEDFISRMAIVEHGAGREVLQTIAEFLQVSVEKVVSRFAALSPKGLRSKTKRVPPPTIQSSVSDIHGRSILRSLENVQGQEDGFDQTGKAKAAMAPSEENPDKSTTLLVALDSFDTLFCRRCLVFNCALHDFFEENVGGLNEKPPACIASDFDQSEPCSIDCRFSSAFSCPKDILISCKSGSTSRRSSTNFSVAAEAWQSNPGGGSRRRLTKGTRTSVVDVEEINDKMVLFNCDLLTNTGESQVPKANLKSQAKMSIIGATQVAKEATKVPSGFLNLNIAPTPDVNDAESISDLVIYKLERKLPESERDDVSRSPRSPGGANSHSKQLVRHSNGEVTFERYFSAFDVQQRRTRSDPETKWNRLEKDLCEKGMQIFGRNSCLIARNILKGCKSCGQIAEYISHLDVGASDIDKPLSFAGELHTRPVFRRKSRFGRKKAAPKSAIGAVRKRIGKDVGVLNICRQYAPCNCERGTGCGEDCPCILADTHCEKYCGCFKVCQNRFRGCQCSKSMCDRRHCPCFAAGRECDPDVCKFCRLECGHSSTQSCHNMRIMQRKKKRLLLARSDVCTGWGIFAGQSLRKHDYIGEYTGELISRSEADRRGRVYDRETSFLFNLNDHLVVDAFRKGNKLKFANHSARKPNCYAKVLLVGGDHRVGIFAKDKIPVGEELLYDYQYEPEIAPVWATGPS